MTTDPAVTAAAEAINVTAFQALGDAAEAVVAAVRPIIEAEVRERIAADIEAERDSVSAETENDRAYDIGMTEAARIARGLQ